MILALNLFRPYVKQKHCREIFSKLGLFEDRNYSTRINTVYLFKAQSKVLHFLVPVKQTSSKKIAKI